MTTGILSYNSSNDRYGVLVMDLWHNDGLHCGECLDVWDYDKEQWIPTRIEMNRDGWYLVGYDAECPEGLKVRVRA
jgi:hypothetical protein